jgi:Cu2+-exporting ATPase
MQPSARTGWRQRLLERIVRGYLIGIIAVAVISGLAWWFATGDGLRTWSVVTAVLVVSCPCAIGLAFPLADEMATIALRRRGVFVRASDVWTRLNHVRRLVFDKTGTLTLETPVLANPESLQPLDDLARSALLALVRDNPHPVSQCLLENLLSTRSGEALPGDVTEHLGQGISLVAKGHTWRLGRAEWTGATAIAGDSTCFTRDGFPLAQFRFLDSARPDARSELAELSRLGHDTYILSGDHQAKVSQLAAELGLPADHALGECTPQQKADWLARNGAHEARHVARTVDQARRALARWQWRQRRYRQWCQGRRL